MPIVALSLVLSLVACSGDPGGSGPAAAVTGADQAPSPTPTPVLSASVPATPTAGASVAQGAVQAAGLSRADTAAGLRSRTVVWKGSGSLGVVPGTTKAPGRGKVTRVRVEVERGLKVDGPTFAAFVLDTLNDSRSWSHGGARSFARTDGRYDVRVVLASPNTSARMCRPLVTYGKLSCGAGSTAVLTMYRWIRAIPEYRSSPTGYRHYVVNHEVGHTLGHHHQYCAGKGKRAPVMMQQTKGLLGCRPNPWPFP